MRAETLFEEHRLHEARMKYLDAALADDRLCEYMGASRTALTQQRVEQQRHLQLYDAVVTALAPKERWLLQQLYEKDTSMGQLTQEQKSPFYQCAKSTVWRFKERALAHANAFLHSLENDSKPPF